MTKGFETQARISHLNAWRAVDCIIREGSVAAAAEALGVTNAAIAAQVRRLEDRLGCALFRRTSGGLEPVAELVALAPALSGAFAGLASVQEALGRARTPQHVSITLTQTFAETWLPRHLADLFATVGAIDLRLDSRWDVVDLATSDVHFAVRFMDAPGPDLEARDLMPSGVVPVCTPQFARRHGLHAGQRDLSGVPLVDLDVVTSDPCWADWREWSRATGILPSDIAAPRYALTGSGVRLARAGVGLVLGGLSETLHAVADGDLIMPFGRETVVPARYWHRLVWRSGRRFGPLQRKVRDWIVQRGAEDRALMQQVFGV